METEISRAKQVTVARCTDADEWNSFVRRIGCPPFAEWGWGNAIESVYGHDRWYLLASVDGDIVGAAPLIHVPSRLFGDQLVSTAFTSHEALVLGEDHREAASRALLDRIRDLADELGVDYASLRSWNLEDESQPAFEHRNQYVSFEVPLADGPEAVWEGFKSSRQNHVRQGRENVDARVGDSLEDLRTFYRLYLKTMRGHGSPPHPFAFFERLWEEFHSEGKLRLYLAEADGTAVNGTIELVSNDAIYGWKEAGEYEYRDLDGNSLLIWKVLEWGAENDFETYHFGRTREGTGVYTFKKSFGGEKVWQDDYHYFPSGDAALPDPEDDEYDRARHIWRKLPLPVTRIVGPHIRKSISL